MKTLHSTNHCELIMLIRVFSVAQREHNYHMFKLFVVAVRLLTLCSLRALLSCAVNPRRHLEPLLVVQTSANYQVVFAGTHLQYLGHLLC